MSKVINSIRSFTVPFGIVTTEELISYHRESSKSNPLRHLSTPEDNERAVQRIAEEGDKRYPLLPIERLLPLMPDRPDDTPGEIIEIREKGTLYHHLYHVECYDNALSICRQAIDVCYIDCEPDDLLDGFELDLQGKLIDAL